MKSLALGSAIFIGGEGARMERIIIDTDIGSDVDDAMALALAMRSRELMIEGVTTVYGDVEVRAQLAAELLNLGNRSDVKVYKGLEQTILQNREVWWAGHEGEGVLDPQKEYKIEDMHAVDFIIKAVMENPEEITLVPIGPLTNIAAAIIREPQVAKKVKKIIMMAGVTRLGNNALSLPYIEHNIKCDPEAASVVFGSGAPITMVGLDVTMKVLINNDDKNMLKESGDPLNIALSKLIEKWFEFINMDHSAMHDPLAISLLLDPTLVKTEKAKVIIEYDHRPVTGQTISVLDPNGNVDICLDVESEKFNQILLGKLLKN
ncbi:nucleoside hydrolase [Bacillus sp. FJAT-49711]|uniref:nucleoside hydrolase n=1 Tax=Bacillus sp. FJAT-49711 TaxID=2833585 RepID=UPI0032D5A710